MKDLIALCDDADLLVWLLQKLSLCSVGTVEEESHTRDDTFGGLTLVGNLKCAEQFLTIKGVVDRDVNCAGRVRVWACLGNPRYRANWEGENLVCLALNVCKLVLVETTALKPEAFNLNCSFFSETSVVEAWNKFQFIYCNFENSCRSLSQSIQECFRMQ